jgi:hypothetical protein
MKYKSKSTMEIFDQVSDRFETTRLAFLFVIKGLLPFGISLKNDLYFGGISDQLKSSSLHNKSGLDEDFHGCIHRLSIDGREIIFNKHSQLIAQNIGKNKSSIKT